MKAEEIASELKRLSNMASSVEPGLAKRLDEMRRWIKKKKPGLLLQKKVVLLFLEELIRDSRFIIYIKSLDEAEKQEVFANMRPPERFWYKTLFPRWFNSYDPKMLIWRQKMMAGELKLDDEPLIDRVLEQVRRLGGSTLRRYIMDLSMATDLAVSGDLGIILWVQLTTVKIELSADKSEAWESTLRNWGIERGLFVSFNPAKVNIAGDLANEIHRQSDALPLVCYREVSVDL